MQSMYQCLLPPRHLELLTPRLLGPKPTNEAVHSVAAPLARCRVPLARLPSPTSLGARGSATHPEMDSPVAPSARIITVHDARVRSPRPRSGAGDPRAPRPLVASTPCTAPRGHSSTVQALNHDTTSLCALLIPDRRRCARARRVRSLTRGSPNVHSPMSTARSIPASFPPRSPPQFQQPRGLEPASASIFHSRSPCPTPGAHDRASRNAG